MDATTATAPVTAPVTAFHRAVLDRLQAIAEEAEAGGYDRAVELIADAIDHDGVVHAFGTGHSEAFAMEVAGRAGGLIPTNRVALRDTVLYGAHTLAELGGDPPLERDAAIARDLFDTVRLHPADVFVIASNSGVNGSVVGMALLAREQGHPVVAVTSLEHTRAVAPRHPSGKRLSEIADVVIDNRAPFGDTVLDGLAEVSVGAVSSITAAFIAQLLTIEVTRRLTDRGTPAPVYVSANVPGGHERNAGFEQHYAGRIRRTA